MTCVVGVKHEGKVYIGADSLGTDTNGSRQVRKDKKVFKKHNIIFGFCGSFKFGQVLRDEITPVIPDDDVKTTYEYVTKNLSREWRSVLKQHDFDTSNLDSEFLIGINGELFVVDCELAVADLHTQYYAVGAGADIALGALHILNRDKSMCPRSKIRQAIKASSEFNSTVGGPIAIVRI